MTPIIPTRALRCLTHPLTLTAIALVALNDWVLRPLAPSWCTGKLSDIGMLFFLPFLLAALLGFIIPRREKLAAALAFSGVLAGFLLLKASPLSNHWLTAFLPVRAIPDPTDLVTLPAIVAAWIFWHSGPRLTQPPALQWRLLVLPLAALVTLADSAAPSYGMTCFGVRNGILVSYVSSTAYQSLDGGLTWEPGNAGDLSCGLKKDGLVIDNVSPSGMHFRTTVERSVARSVDGQTWETVYSAKELSEPEHTYKLKTVSGNPYFIPGPLDAIVDPRSGNLVVAMGMEGALIVPPTGQITWVEVGNYRHASLKKAGVSGYETLLSWEIWWASAGGLLWLATALLRLRGSIWQIVVTVLGWSILGVSLMTLTPSFATGIESVGGLLLLLLLPFLNLLGLAIALTAIVRARNHSIESILARVATALLLAPVFFLPFLAWGLELVPDYSTAQQLAAFLVLVAVAVGVAWKSEPSVDLQSQQPSQD
jgi:hypothetical protein